MGRTAAGVRAIDLNEGDGVAAFDVVEPDGDLLIITQNGYGKRTPLTEYPSPRPPHRRAVDARPPPAGRDRPDHGRPRRAGQRSGDDHHRQRRGAAHPGSRHQPDEPQTRGVRIVTPDGGDTVAAMARLGRIGGGGVATEVRPSLADREGRRRRRSGRRGGRAGRRDGEAGDGAEVELTLSASRALTPCSLTAFLMIWTAGHHATHQRCHAAREPTLCPYATLLRRGVGLQLEVMPEPSSRRAGRDPGRVRQRRRRHRAARRAARWARSTGDLQLEDAESLLRAALTQCRPLVRTDWQTFEDRDGLAVAITVPRSIELHSLADGRVLVRTHSGNEPLDGAKISHLAATKASGDFEMETVAGRDPCRPGR